MEQLDYLIRSLTYLQSVLELDMKKLPVPYQAYHKGVIAGLNIAITEIYKLIGDQLKEQ